MSQHPHLMSPLALRGQTLRNRIVFGAHTNNMSDQGIPAPAWAAISWNAPSAGPRWWSASRSRPTAPAS
jgi:2,4-dienoyl-CoA reductase-like NADH-dependent reductase (Old Yellow Enzyme family)